MSKITTILIVANSARMLTQMAKNCGLSALVIDCYSDLDTQAIALECVKVKTLAVAHINKAYSYLISKYRVTYFVYGSGFEFHPSGLKFLQQKLCILGNTHEVFSSIQDTCCFFSRLDHLQIPYPQISEQKPDARDNWLIKPKQGQGGFKITEYTDFSANYEPMVYWQKYIDGIPMSVLFVANSMEFKIYGFHKQFVTTIDDNNFVFAGLISQPEINENIVRIVTVWLTKLVPEFALLGLNSLDFILKNNCCYALEVNARPSASMQLYHASLLSDHINTCLRRPWANNMPAEEGYKAYLLVFAETEFRIKNTIQWPLWVKDIPEKGSFITTGMPICSIIARGKNEQRVIDELLIKQRTIKKLLQ